MTGIEPVSENPSIQLSPGALCHLNFPSVNAGTQALTLGSHFMRDLFNGERQMHVHRYMTLSPEPRYSPEERAVLQTAAPLTRPVLLFRQRLILSWAVSEIARLYPLTVYQNPRRNLYAPMWFVLFVHEKRIDSAHLFIGAPFKVILLTSQSSI